MAYKVLLADDSITIQKVVELILSEEDAVVRTVSNGMEALESLEHMRPDIVLADVEMPNMNGYDICKKIKENPNTRSIPVILLAGAFESFDEDRARGVGAEDFIVKPFDSQDLLEKINRARGVAASSVTDFDSVARPGEVETPPDAENKSFETKERGIGPTFFDSTDSPREANSLEKLDEIVSSGDDFDEAEDFWEAEEIQISDMLSEESAGDSPSVNAFSAETGFAGDSGDAGLGLGPLQDAEPDSKDNLTGEFTDETLGAEPGTPSFAAKNPLHEPPGFDKAFEDVVEDKAEESVHETETGISGVFDEARPEETGLSGLDNNSSTAGKPGMEGVSTAEISPEDVAGAVREAVASSINIPAINSDEILLGVLKEKVSEVIPDKDVILDMAKIAISASMPARMEIEEQIKSGIGNALGEGIPAGSDVQGMIRSAIRMDEISQDIKEAAFEAIEKHLTPIFKTVLEEVLWEVIPGMAEKTVERVLSETMAKDLKDTIIAEAKRTIPEIAERLISLEMERFRSSE